MFFSRRVSFNGEGVFKKYQEELLDSEKVNELFFSPGSTGLPRVYNFGIWDK